VLAGGQRIAEQRNETQVTRRYCRQEDGRSGSDRLPKRRFLAVSRMRPTLLGETGKLPDRVILGSPAISRELHVRVLILSVSVICSMTGISIEYVPGARCPLFSKLMLYVYK
jgi:hypothetical protein